MNYNQISIKLAKLIEVMTLVKIKIVRNFQNVKFTKLKLNIKIKKQKGRRLLNKCSMQRQLA